MSASEFDYTPEERAAYERGLGDSHDANQAIRSAAFEAIRRAAAVARYCDHEAGRAFPVNPPQTAEEERLRLIPDKAVRRAIRAAIGSPKA